MTRRVGPVESVVVTGEVDPEGLLPKLRHTPSSPWRLRSLPQAHLNPSPAVNPIPDPPRPQAPPRDLDPPLLGHHSPLWDSTPVSTSLGRESEDFTRRHPHKETGGGIRSPYPSPSDLNLLLLLLPLTLGRGPGSNLEERAGVVLKGGGVRHLCGKSFVSPTTRTNKDGRGGSR